MCGRAGHPLYSGLSDRLFGTKGAWTLARCPDASCGLIWLDPMPAVEDISKAYEEYYTHSDDTSEHSSLMLRLFLAAKEGYLAQKYGYKEERLSLSRRLAGWLIRLHPGRRTVFDFNVMWLAPVPGGRLLDVGCGSGAFLEFMQQLGWRVEGVDFDAGAARNASAKGVRVNVGPLEEQGLAENTFDAITMSHFIEHVHDPERVVKEAWRLLRPGGRLVMVTPNSQSFGHSFYGADWMHLDPPRHLHLFNRITLQRLAHRAGFEKVEAFTSIRDAYGMFIGSRAIQRQGAYVMGSPQSLGVRLWARAMELAEFLASGIRPNIGEEVVVIAQK